jgi:glycosyltransferase involved in cell wall biosynthesis
MRILYIVDGRSPIALNWIAYFVQAGHEVHLASTYPCDPPLKLAGLYPLQVAFGELAGDPARAGSVVRRSGLRKLIPVGLRTAIRQRLGPMTLSRAVPQLRDVIQSTQPDLVHAMRIPYEGMLAALADPAVPLLVSIWGNDFTLHAPATSTMKRLTHETVRRASAIHADCYRDIKLAQTWGFPTGRPYQVLPGNGGIQLDVFHPSQNPLGNPPIVVNPRGFRAYVRNDVFFQSIPLVLRQRPETRFLCPTMAGEAQAQTWIKQLKIGNNVELLPRLAQAELVGLFQNARVVVSPTTHDGTPNTLLEALACGCFPVAGDLESIREWITPGVNGLLVDPADPQALAEAVLLALDQPELRRRAAKHNRQLVEQRADYARCMQTADNFYQSLIAANRKV